MFPALWYHIDFKTIWSLVPHRYWNKIKRQIIFLCLDWICVKETAWKSACFHQVGILWIRSLRSIATGLLSPNLMDATQPIEQSNRYRSWIGRYSLLISQENYSRTTLEHEKTNKSIQNASLCGNSCFNFYTPMSVSAQLGFSWCHILFWFLYVMPLKILNNGYSSQHDVHIISCQWNQSHFIIKTKTISETHPCVIWMSTSHCFPCNVVCIVTLLCPCFFVCVHATARVSWASSSLSARALFAQSTLSTLSASTAAERQR